MLALAAGSRAQRSSTGVRPAHQATIRVPDHPEGIRHSLMAVLEGGKVAPARGANNGHGVRGFAAGWALTFRLWLTVIRIASHLRPARE
jgi:hypothetical protein